MAKKSSKGRKVDKKNILGVSSAQGQAGPANYCCHNFTGQIPGDSNHVMRNPRVVLVLWGHYYFTNTDVSRTLTTLVTDLVTYRYMNGLAQYGVSHGSLVGTIVVDIPTNVPDPTGLTRAAVQNKLVSWIRNGQVFPAPAVDEQNLVYLIFLPTNSTFTDIGVGYHNFGKYNRVSSDNDLFWGVILTNYPPRTSAGAFVNALTYIVSHELCEAFSDRDGKGFTTANTSCTFSGPPITRITNACEIGDVCESRGTNTCCYTYSYHVTNRTWQVEQYWSNWDNQCINGDQPVSLRQFLQAIGVDGSTGLRQLQSNVINVDFVASKM